MHNGEFDWETIKGNADHFIHFHGVNDPYIDPQEAEILAEKTGGKLIMILNGKHLNQSAGYRRFERLADELRKILGPQ
jgi:predicted alpha/beta hydrolase family esterase